MFLLCNVVWYKKILFLRGAAKQNKLKRTKKTTMSNSGEP